MKMELLSDLEARKDTFQKKGKAVAPILQPWQRRGTHE